MVHSMVKEQWTKTYITPLMTQRHASAYIYIVLKIKQFFKLLITV